MVFLWRHCFGYISIFNGRYISSRYIWKK